MWKSPLTTFDHSISSVAGSDITNKYRLTTNELGQKELDISGQYSRQDLINSYHDDCEYIQLMSSIDPQHVNALSYTYDVNDLNELGILDYTALPRSTGEAFLLLKEAQTVFDGLPLEDREHFNFSSEYFYKSIGSKAFRDYYAAKKSVNTSVDETEKGDTVNE